MNPPMPVCRDDNPPLTITLALNAHERCNHDDRAVAYQARG